MKKSQIGWFVLDEEKDYYNEYETAAWFEKVRVQPGRFPIGVYDLSFRKDGKMDSHCGMAYVTMDGTIVCDNFQSLYCGVPIGSVYDETKNAGKPATHSASWYLYSIAELVADGDKRVELFPEYEVKESSRYNWDGSEHVLYGIYRKEETK